MVKRRISADGSDSYYDQLQESWPEERPSRRRQRRTHRRKEERQVVVEPKRLPRPSTAHISRALLAAQRELAQAQAEKEAQSNQSPEGSD